MCVSEWLSLTSINREGCKLLAEAGSVEGELYRCLYRLPPPLPPRKGPKNDRASLRPRINNEIAAAAEFEAVGRMAAKVVGCQTRIFVALADVNRPPLAVGKKLRPAMIAVSPAIVPLRRNCRADGEARRDAHRPCQGNEVRVKIRAVAGAGVAGVDRVALTPAVAVLDVAHAVDDVVVERPGAHQVTRLALDDPLADLAEILIDRHQTLRGKVLSWVGGRRRISGLLKALHLIADLDLLAAVFGTEIEEKDFVAVLPLRQDALLPRSLDGFDLHRLERVRGRQRKPHAGGTGYLGQSGPVEKLELVPVSDDTQVPFRSFF